MHTVVSGLLSFSAAANLLVVLLSFSIWKHEVERQPLGSQYASHIERMSIFICGISGALVVLSLICIIAIS